MRRSTILRTTVAVIAVSQFGFGLAYLLGASQFNQLLGLAPAPGWTTWPFAMLGARFLALGFGMLLALRDPVGNRGWIQAMIGVQAIDWVATLFEVATGAVTLRQVAAASFLPLLFIAGLLAGYPRSASRLAVG